MAWKNKVVSIIYNTSVLLVRKFPNLFVKHRNIIHVKNNDGGNGKKIFCVVGVGWNFLDSVLPLLTWLKKKEYCNIYILFSSIQAHDIKKSEKERYQSIYDIADHIYMASLGDKSEVKKEIGFTIANKIREVIKDAVSSELRNIEYWKSIIKNTFASLHVDAVIMTNDADFLGINLLLREIFSKAVFVNMHPICFSRIANINIEDDSLGFSFDYYITTDKYFYPLEINRQNVEKIFVGGAPRLDSWWINNRISASEVTSLKKKLNFQKKTILCLFSELNSQIRFDVSEKIAFLNFLKKHNFYNFIFKFHPRNTEFDRQIFIKKFIPNDTSWIESQLETVQCASVSDIILTVGLTSSIADVITLNIPIISFYNSKINRPFFTKTDNGSYMSCYEIYDMICHANDETELGNLINGILQGHEWDNYANNYKQFFPNIEHPCSYISSFLLEKIK